MGGRTKIRGEGGISTGLAPGIGGRLLQVGVCGDRWVTDGATVVYRVGVTLDIDMGTVYNLSIQMQLPPQSPSATPAATATAATPPATAFRDALFDGVEATGAVVEVAVDLK